MKKKSSNHKIEPLAKDAIISLYGNTLFFGQPFQIILGIYPQIIAPQSTEEEIMKKWRIHNFSNFSFIFLNPIFSNLN